MKRLHISKTCVSRTITAPQARSPTTRVSRKTCTSTLLMGLVGTLIGIQGVCYGAPFQEESFFKRHAEGWFWYQDPLLEEDLEKGKERDREEQLLLEQKGCSSSQSISKKLTPEERATQAVKAYQQEILGKRNLALSQPTYKNVAAYMRIQKEMAQKASYFGQTWQQVVLNEPDLNFERVYPTAQVCAAHSRR